MIKLRPYQNDIIKSLRTTLGKHRRTILCAPTGAGKTIMFTYLISEHLKRGGNVLVLTHRTELLKQSGSSFQKFGLSPEFIVAGSKPDLSAKLHVCMVETLERRKEAYNEFILSKSLVVIDEAHLNIFTKILPSISPKAYVIGATATPERKGRTTPSLDEFYTGIVQRIDTPQLIEQGFLSTAKTYGMPISLKGIKRRGNDYDTSEYYEENKTYIGVVKNWKRLCEGKKTILFASNVKSSKRVCEEFNASGYPARHIDGNTPQNEREETLEWFNKTPDAIVCNCGILNAGFDQPDIESVILYRATTSLPLYLQMCGRGSRTTKDLNEFTILDFGENVKRHGFWEDDRVWSLSKKAVREMAAPVKDCPKCMAMLPTQAKECQYCGHIFPVKLTEAEEVELQLLDKAKIMSEFKTMSNRELAEACKDKTIKASWVLHNKTDKEDARDFIKEMGYKKSFEFVNKKRYNVFRS